MGFAKKPAARITILAIATILAFVIAFMTPPEGYTVELMRFIGIFVWMLICMIFSVFPDWLAMLIGLTVCCITNVSAFNVIFAQFGNTTIWSMIALTAFIAALSGTGLFKRIALKVLTFFKPTYKGKVLAVMCSGVVLAPMVPSVISKFGILQPIASSVSLSGGYKNGSKPATGLFSAAFFPAWVLSYAFVSGSTSVYMLLGYIGDYAAPFTWGYWFMASAVWFVVVAVLMYLFIINYYKPTAADIDASSASTATAKENYEALGPMSKDEKFALIVLLICVVLWITESMHGISAVYVSLLAWAAVTIKGYFGPKQFGTAIPWMVVVQTGLILGLITLCGVTGFNNWIGGIVTPFLGGLAANAYLMVIVICLVTYVLRVFVVPATVTLVIYAALGPVVIAAGMNPWFVVFVSYMAGLCWTTKFTSVAIVQAEAFSNGLSKYENTMPTNIAYMVINMIALLASVPVWSLIGII